MKTAEEIHSSLTSEVRILHNNINYACITLTEIKQIQLDAMKEGMRRAAKYCAERDQLQKFGDGLAGALESALTDLGYKPKNNLILAAWKKIKSGQR